MINERWSITSRLMKLEKPHRKSIIRESREEAYEREGKLWFHIKWYAFQLLVLSIIGFCAGFSIAASTDIIGYPKPDSNVVVATVVVAIIVFWSKIHERGLAWFLYPYLAKRFAEDKI